MEDNYRNNDFEEYVKQHADQFRMFPSDKVWNGVHKALHTRRRWYGFGLAFLLLMTGGAVTWVMNTYPVSRKQPFTGIAQNNVGVRETGNTSDAIADNGLLSDRSTGSGLRVVPAGSEPADIRELLPITGTSSNRPDPETAPSIAEENIAATITRRLTQGLAEELTHGGLAQVLIPDPTNPFTKNNLSQGTPAVESEPVVSGDGPENRSVVITSSHRTFTLVNAPNSPMMDNVPFKASRLAGEETIARINAQPVRRQRAPSDADQASAQAVNDFMNQFAIESIVNSYKAPRKHLSWQFFVTPTISYRRLSENKDFSELAGDPINGVSNYPFATLTDVNNAVQHKPDLGLQIGFNARYPLTKALRLRGGFQFNINRYDIKAFVNNGEVAHIELSGTSNNTVAAWTNYRSQGGSRLDWLKNFYLSFSAPVGLEVTVFESKKKHTSIGFAGTVQPTYVVRDRAYLISTDYKNYAQVPWLIRHVNVSTGFETFVNYQKGKTQWQVGPQVRYQLMSSFHNKYPVKENLFDFGLKIGVTLNK